MEDVKPQQHTSTGIKECLKVFTPVRWVSLQLDGVYTHDMMPKPRRKDVYKSALIKPQREKAHARILTRMSYVEDAICSNGVRPQVFALPL